MKNIWQRYFDYVGIIEKVEAAVVIGGEEDDHFRSFGCTGRLMEGEGDVLMTRVSSGE